MKKSKTRVQGKGKKLLSVVLAALTIGSTVVTTGSLTGVGISANAVTSTTSTSASNFKYSKKSDGTISITGYKGSSTNVVIPSKIDGKNVTEIAENAFSNKSVKSVSIPSSVKSIGSSAFYACKSLTSIKIPDSVTSPINSNTFNSCIALKSVTIGKGVKEIAANAFSGCQALESVTMGSGLKKIREGAFSDCKMIKSVDIPSGVEEIGDQAFWFCSGLSKISIPKSVTSIGVNVFYGCGNLTICGVKGSVAQTYAKNNGINFDEMLVNKSKISKTTVYKGDTVTLTGAATGGKSPYKYAFAYRNANSKTWKTVKSYSSSSTYNAKMNKAGKYYLCVYVKDSTGKTVTKIFTVDVLEPLTNKSTISNTTVKKGTTITLKTAATGGKSPYKYAFAYRNSNSKTWKTVKSYSSSSTYNAKMNKAGKYYQCVYVKDSMGKVLKKTFTVTVK